MDLGKLLHADCKNQAKHIVTTINCVSVAELRRNFDETLWPKDLRHLPKSVKSP